MDYEQLRIARNEDKGFNKYLGFEYAEIKDGYARVELTLEPKHLNPKGEVHGGCIFSLMDTAGGVAAITKGNLATTSSAHINFLNSGHCGKLVAVATEVKSGKSLMVFEVEVRDENEKLLSKGTFTFFRLNQQYTPGKTEAELFTKE